MNLIFLAPLAAIFMMFAGFFLRNKDHVAYLAMALAAILLIANSFEMAGQILFNFDKAGNMIQTTKFGLLMNEICLFALFALFLLNGRDLKFIGFHVAEYFALMFFILSGIGIATSFANLLMFFLSIEIITIPLFALAGAEKRNLKSVEAALKYFLMGVFSSAVLLLGLALIYGATGSLSLDKFNLASTPISYNLAGGMLLVLAGMTFKVGAAPFHFWTPDVYDGAPTPITSFMATVVKVGSFAAFISIFNASFDIAGAKWKLAMAIIIALTLLIGNLTAVFQQNLKRMLAYSSISQAGFILFAIFAMNLWSHEGMILYSAAYSLATVGAFAILNKMDDQTYDGFNGFAKQHPLLALTISIFMLSLAGIPLTAGFFGKYYMLSAALQDGGRYLWLVILAVVCAAISVYYYFRWIQSMYFKAGEATASREITPVFTGVMVVLAVLILFIGVMPQWLLQYLYF